ncbi:hypothetical protein HPB52_001645 [Rhipicephalus sanguineus]|uniref:Uncharacterized protein n=1 Tax=Rhipicephalus sanguineus TaxID=34632 RepID=A0A9D4Q483_RHISA|nr:hypothetical protein HPB52_001645 [Rhipicephalus sanguineus]
MCQEQSSAVQFRAVEKASTCEGSSRFKNEPRLEAAKDAALIGEAAEDHSQRDEVLCQWNTTETTNRVAENLAQTPSECVAALDFACGVQGDFDPLGKNTRVRSLDGARVESREYNAVVDSSQICELSWSEESSCIVPKRFRLSASLPSKEDDDLFVSHLDCVGETTDEGFEKVDEHQMRAGCSKGGKEHYACKERLETLEQCSRSEAFVIFDKIVFHASAPPDEKKKKGGLCANAAQWEGVGSPAVLSAARLMGHGSAESVDPKK